MKNVFALHKRGYLTERQVLVASKFSQKPNDFTLAPSLYRILHDLIILDVPLEAYEQRKGWCARSAKVLLSQLLYALQEVDGVWWSSEAAEYPEDDIEHLRDVIRFLTGDNEQELFDLIQKYDLVPGEARIFAVLHAQNGPLTRETILRRAYHGRSEDEYPDHGSIDVYVCKLRPKIRNDWVIKTVWGMGYALERVRDATSDPDGFASENPPSSACEV